MVRALSPARAPSSSAGWHMPLKAYACRVWGTKTLWWCGGGNDMQLDLNMSDKIRGNRNHSLIETRCRTNILRKYSQFIPKTPNNLPLSFVNLHSQWFTVTGPMFASTWFVFNFYGFKNASLYLHTKFCVLLHLYLNSLIIHFVHMTGSQITRLLLLPWHHFFSTFTERVLCLVATVQDA